jgi:threonine synthase
MERVQSEFLSCSVGEKETLETIAAFHRETGYTLDPHTADGVHAALACVTDGSNVVCLATAHPAKFGEAVEKGTGFPTPLPPGLAALEGLETRCEVMVADRELIKGFLQKRAR